jgi:hypothetical protein
MTQKVVLAVNTSAAASPPVEGCRSCRFRRAHRALLVEASRELGSIPAGRHRGRYRQGIESGNFLAATPVSCWETKDEPSRGTGWDSQQVAGAQLLGRQTEREVAEADGNRTRLSRVAAHTGFEDRGAHQDPDASKQAF